MGELRSCNFLLRFLVECGARLSRSPYQTDPVLFSRARVNRGRLTVEMTYCASHVFRGSSLTGMNVYTLYRMCIPHVLFARGSNKVLKLNGNYEIFFETRSIIINVQLLV